GLHALERELPLARKLRELLVRFARVVLAQPGPSERELGLFLQAVAERKTHLLDPARLVATDDALAPDVAPHLDQRLDHGLAHVTRVLDRSVRLLNRREDLGGVV